MQRWNWLNTERLTLRPLGPEYLESTHVYASDAVYTRMMMFLPYENLAETRAWLEDCAAEWEKAAPQVYEFAVLRGGDHIGHVGIELNDARDAAELEWILRPDCQGHGYAVEAARALMDFTRRELGIHHFIAHCDAENAASQRVMQRLGMVLTETGTRKNRGSDALRREYLFEYTDAEQP